MERLPLYCLSRSILLYLADEPSLCGGAAVDHNDNSPCDENIKCEIKICYLCKGFISSLHVRFNILVIHLLFICFLMWH